MFHTNGFKRIYRSKAYRKGDLTFEMALIAILLLGREIWCLVGLTVEGTYCALTTGLVGLGLLGLLAGTYLGIRAWFQRKANPRDD